MMDRPCCTSRSARFSDSTHLVFFVRRGVKQKVCVCTVNDHNPLQRRIINTWDKINKEINIQCCTVSFLSFLLPRPKTPNGDLYSLPCHQKVLLSPKLPCCGQSCCGKKIPGYNQGNHLKEHLIRMLLIFDFINKAVKTYIILFIRT